VEVQFVKFPRTHPPHHNIKPLDFCTGALEGRGFRPKIFDNFRVDEQDRSTILTIGVSCIATNLRLETDLLVVFGIISIVGAKKLRPAFK